MSSDDKEMDSKGDVRKKKPNKGGKYWQFLHIAKNKSASTRPTSTANKTNEIGNLKEAALLSLIRLSTLAFAPSYEHHLSHTKAL